MFHHEQDLCLYLEFSLRYINTAMKKKVLGGKGHFCEVKALRKLSDLCHNWILKILLFK